MARVHTEAVALSLIVRTMKSENDIRINILREATDLKPGTGLVYHQDRLANEIASELLDSGLVMGSISEHGTACITGIRDSGRDHIENQKPHRKALSLLRRLLFVAYSIGLLIIGYILDLDSVKAFFSELMANVLK